MPGLSVTGERKFGSLNDIEFNWYPTSALSQAMYSNVQQQGGINIKETPQQIADNQLTQATNVYLRFDGGVEMRRGIIRRGPSLGVTQGQGLFRLSQQVVNGIAQTTPQTFTLAQVLGNLYSVDQSGLQIGPANVVGASAFPWSACQIYDPTHLQSPPVAPTLTTTTGGSLVAGTYVYELTATTAAGETTVGYQGTITTLATRKIVLTWAAVPGATGYKVYGRTAGSQLLIGTLVGGGTTSFTDDGTVVPAGAVPGSNTAGTAPSDVCVICTGVGGPYLFDGYTVSTPAAWTTNAAAARWCTVVNNVLWFGGIKIQPNLLVGSQVGSPEIEPFYQQIALSKPITGLGVIGAGAQAALVAGMVQGLSVLSGVGPANFVLQEVPSQDGVVAGRTMLCVAGILYFLGSLAIYAFDGQNVAPISDPIEPWVLNDPLYTDFSFAGDKRLAWAFWDDHRLYFVYDATAIGYPNSMVVYDTRLQGWTVVTGLAAQMNAGCLRNAPGVDPTPFQQTVISSTTGQCYDFDQYAVQPAVPVLSQVASGALASTTYFVQVTFTLASGGESTPSGQTTLAVSANNVLVVATPGTNASAVSWNVYVGTTSTVLTRQASGLALSANWQEPNSGLVVGVALPVGRYAHSVDDDGTVIAASVASKFFKLGQPGTRKKLRRLYYETFTETFNGTAFVTTDYGLTTVASVTGVTAMGGSLWDQSSWDSAVWAGSAVGSTFLVYTKQRLDFNLQGEAFAFGLSSANTNPPWRWMGLSGVFVQGARN